MPANTARVSVRWASSMNLAPTNGGLPSTITAPLRGQHIVPVQRERVAVHDVRAGAQRDAGKVQAELLAHPQVHLVVHEPQGHLGNLGRELLNLDAVKLVHVQADQAVHVHTLLARVRR
jgi:hypothetical protein